MDAIHYEPLRRAVITGTWKDVLTLIKTDANAYNCTQSVECLRVMAYEFGLPVTDSYPELQRFALLTPDELLVISSRIGDLRVIISSITRGARGIEGATIRAPNDHVRDVIYKAFAANASRTRDRSAESHTTQPHSARGW